MSYDGHYANVYDQIFHQEDMARSTADFLGALMPEHSAKALELGIGTGRVALRLAAKGHPIVGVDASQGMLDVLQEKLTEFDTYAVEVHLGDMATWEPLGEEKFELVYSVLGSIACLPTLDQQRAALIRACANVADEGHLVIESYNPPPLLRVFDQVPSFEARAEYPHAAAQLHSLGKLDDNRLSVTLDHTWSDGGGDRNFLEQVHLIDPHIISSIVQENGLELSGLYGDWSRSPYDEFTTAMFVAAFKRTHT